MKIDLSAGHVGWTAKEAPLPDFSAITVAFQDCVRRTPAAVALALGSVDGAPTETLTYAGLDVRARDLARLLVAKGVKPGDRVGFATRRDFDVIVAMLGVLMAGGVYVPLDLSYPRQRLEFMQRDSGVRIIALSAGLATEIAAKDVQVVEIGSGHAPHTVDLPVVEASDPAYVIYTSGSTGEPKGVVTPHRAVLRLTVGASYTRFGPDRRVLQMAPVSFDAATFEIWGALLNGGTCVIYPDTGLPDFARLRAVLETAAINTLWLTSSVFNAIVDADVEMLAGVEELLVGGEALLGEPLAGRVVAVPHPQGVRRAPHQPRQRLRSHRDDDLRLLLSDSARSAGDHDLRAHRPADREHRHRDPRRGPQPRARGRGRRALRLRRRARARLP